MWYYYNDTEQAYYSQTSAAQYTQHSKLLSNL